MQRIRKILTIKSTDFNDFFNEVTNGMGVKYELVNTKYIYACLALAK
jgi:hypothetical protein